MLLAEEVAPLLVPEAASMEGTYDACPRPPCFPWRFFCLGAPPAAEPPPELEGGRGAEGAEEPLVTATRAVDEEERLAECSSCMRSSWQSAVPPCDDLVVGGKQMSATQMEGNGGVVLVQAAEHIENKSAIRNGLAKITEPGRHLLKLPTVFSDGQIALHELTKLHVEVEESCLPVAEKLGLEDKPGGAGGGVVLHCSVGEVGRDDSIDPRLDDAIHAHPVQEDARRRIVENVMLQGKLADDK